MNIAEALKEAALALRQKSNSAWLDAEILLAHVLEQNREYLLVQPVNPLSRTQLKKYRTLLKKRQGHEPIAYLIKCREFYGRRFLVSPSVLIPRPESEFLVDQALYHFRRKKRKLVIAEIGTGSGAIAVSLALALPSTTIYATDISADAISVARKNASYHRVAGKIFFRRGSLLKPLQGVYCDAIVANLPYLTSSACNQPDLAFEPRLALDGGPAGLDYLQELFQEIAKMKTLPEIIVLEHGPKQAISLQQLALKYLPAYQTKEIKDYSKQERVLVLKKAGLRRPRRRCCSARRLRS